MEKIACSGLSFLAVFVLLSAFASADVWPMFHHDLNHSGFSSEIVNPSKLVEKWSWYVDGYGIMSEPTVVDGIVFMGKSQGGLWAYNASSGEYIWNFPFDPSWSFAQAAPAVANGIVYEGNFWNHNAFCAVNESTGIKIWCVNMSSSGVTSSATVSGGAVFFGGLDALVLALNASTGAHIWNYSVGDSIESSPAVSGGVVYIGSRDNSVYALNASTGAHIWNYTTGDDVYYSSPAVAYGRVYVGSRDHYVYALNASTGALLWSYRTGGNIDSSPALAYGRVYIGSEDTHLYALNASTGAQLWNYTADNGFSRNTPVVANGVVYFNGWQQYDLKALNSTTGGLVWSYSTPWYSTSPALADGMLFMSIGSTGFDAFTQDFASPAVRLDAPQNGTTTSDHSQTFTCNATETYELANITLNVWNATGLFASETQGASGNFTSNSFNVLEMANGGYTWNCLAIDSVNNAAYAPSNSTFTVFDGAIQATNRLYFGWNLISLPINI
ncbi:Outer membrane protein assembly factor BamB [uncultured archaeon]|nr:Outer membrane protein assembly factor BamB [uncultured archaeon]